MNDMRTDSPLEQAAVDIDIDNDNDNDKDTHRTMAKLDIQRIVAENLQRFMAKRGDNQTTLAKRSGVSQTMIGKILRQETSPSLDTLVLLADAFKIPTEFLTSKTMDETSATRIAQMDMEANAISAYYAIQDEPSKRAMLSRWAQTLVVQNLAMLSNQDLEALLTQVLLEKASRIPPTEAP